MEEMQPKHSTENFDFENHVYDNMPQILSDDNNFIVYKF